MSVKNCRKLLRTKNSKLSLAEMVRFCVVELIHLDLNPKIDMCITYL
jgi:hypothetical protein